jgi:hypothetical protein
MALAPSLINGSGLSLVSAIAEQLTQPSALLSGTNSPSQKGEQKANREPRRLETIATHTKQKAEPISNREKEAIFYPHFCSPGVDVPSQEGEQKANRERLRLETLVTHRKHKAGVASNREKEALFQIIPRHQNAPTHPPFLLRLKTTPIPCFVELTHDFDRNTLRLRRISIEPKFRLLSSLRGRKTGGPTRLVVSADERPSPTRKCQFNGDHRHPQERRSTRYCNAQDLAVASL